MNEFNSDLESEGEVATGPEAETVREGEEGGREGSGGSDAGDEEKEAERAFFYHLVGRRVNFEILQNDLASLSEDLAFSHCVEKKSREFSHY